MWVPHGPQFLPGTCSFLGSAWAAASFRAHAPAAVWGPPQAAVWISCLAWSSVGCRRTNCSTMVLSMRHRGVCCSAWSTSSSPSPLTLVSAELFLSHFSYSSFLQWLCSVFYLFSNMFSQRCHQRCCLAQQGPAVALFRELAGTSCVWHGGSPWLLLMEAIPAAPPLPKSCHVDPIQYQSCFLIQGMLTPGSLATNTLD